MGDFGDFLGKAIGGLFGVVENGVKAAAKWSEENSSYFTCPHCGHEQKQPNYRCFGSALDDTGRRTCNKCQRYFYIK